MEQDRRDVEAAAGGDREAFARLYDRHAGVVLALCRVKLGPDAEDALQETFLRAYRKLGEVSEPEGFRSWLYAIARHVCSERLRSDRRRKRREEDGMLRASHETRPPGTPAEAAQDHEELDRLAAALDVLPEEERLAIHLYYLDADPVAAAREALGLSRSGFYKLLKRARERLAGVLTASNPA